MPKQPISFSTYCLSMIHPYRELPPPPDRSWRDVLVRAYTLVRRCRWLAATLLVVVASYGAFCAWIYRGYDQRSRRNHAWRLAALANAAETIQTRHGGFCPFLEEIREEAGGDVLTFDDHGHSFVVRCDARGVEIRCIGRDGIAGTSDDQYVMVKYFRLASHSTR